VVIKYIKEKPPARIDDDGTWRGLSAEGHHLPAKLLPDDAEIDPLNGKVDWRLGRRKERRIEIELLTLVGARSQRSSVEVRPGDQQSSERQQGVSTVQHDSHVKYRVR
jgi:hypothetical protein